MVGKYGGGGYPVDPATQQVDSAQEPRSLVVPKEKPGTAQTVGVGIAQVPTTLIGGDGIRVEVSNFRYAVNLDIAKLEPAGPGQAAQQWLPIWDENTGTDEVRRVPVQVIPADAPRDGIVYGRMDGGWVDVTANVTIDWGDIQDVPPNLAYLPISQDDVTNLTTDLAAINTAIGDLSTNKVSKSGDTMTGPLSLPSTGTQSSTAINFGTAGSGFYGNSTDMRYSIGGSVKLVLTASTFQVANVLRVTPGTAAAPALHFGTATTGFYGDATSVSTATSGVNRLTVSTTAVTSTLPVVLPAAPTTDLQAATKKYVDDTTGAVNTAKVAKAGDTMTGGLNVAGDLSVNATVGNNAVLSLRTDGLYSWRIVRAANTRNLSLNRYDDTSTFVGTAFIFDYATGQMSLTLRPTWQGFTPWDSNNFNPANYLSTGGGTLTGTLTINPTSGTSASIELGRTGVANTAYIDFHSGATTADFDSRIQATGGNGTTGGGVLQFTSTLINYNAATHTFSARPTFGGNLAWDAGNFTPSNYLPLTGGTMTGNLKLRANAPILYFSEADQAAPAGEWRFVADGTQFRLDRATAVDGNGNWTTATKPISVNNADVVTLSMRPIFGTATPWDSANYPMDITTTAPTTGQALVWSGTKFVPTTLGSGLGDGPSDGALYGRLNAAWVKGVKLAGDTMTGSLVMAPITPIETPAAGGVAARWLSCSADTAFNGYVNTAGNQWRAMSTGYIGVVGFDNTNGNFVIQQSTAVVNKDAPAISFAPSLTIGRTGGTMTGNLTIGPASGNAAVVLYAAGLGYGATFEQNTNGNAYIWNGSKGWAFQADGSLGAPGGASFNSNVYVTGSISASGNITAGNEPNLWMGRSGNANLTSYANGIWVGFDTAAAHLKMLWSGVCELRLQSDANMVFAGNLPYKPGGGPWADSSDNRIKTELGTYDVGLAEIAALRPVRYRFRGNDTDAPPSPVMGGEIEPPYGGTLAAPYANSTHRFVAESGKEFVGLMAQEVEAIIPDMVTKRAAYIDGEPVTDLRDLDPGPLVFALINAVKELKAQNEALLARVEELEARP